jgi:hypothetical protein
LQLKPKKKLRVKLDSTKVRIAIQLSLGAEVLPSKKSNSNKRSMTPRDNREPKTSSRVRKTTTHSFAGPT